MAASLRDVANMVGVSISTVSRALHRPEMVDAKTRARIELAVNALGYVPQGVGRALVSRRTGTIGAVVPRVGVSAFSQTLEALRHALGQENYTLLLAQPGLGEDADIRPLRTLLERGVDGVVLLGNDSPASWHDLATKNKLPVALIWADASNAPAGSVGFDNYQAGKQAADHLLELGHREFAYISGHLAPNQRARQRYLGLLETIAAGHGSLSRELIIETDYGFSEGYQAAQNLLTRKHRFTALICGNDYLALGAIAGLRDKGLRVPDDISVVGFNNSEFAPFVDPPLTTIHFPSVDIGLQAAQTILRGLEANGVMPEATILPTHLVARQSTRKVAVASSSHLSSPEEA